MRLTAIVLLLGKVQKPWTDSTGSTRTSYFANVVQNNGEIIDTLRLTQDQYNTLEVNQTYSVDADFGIGKNGGYLRILDIYPKNPK